MKKKAKTRESYLSPDVTFTWVELEDGMVAVQSPVNSVTLEEWEEGGSNDPGDSGNVYLGL